MTLRGMLLSLGVLAAFLAIFVPLARLINGNRDRSIDASRMRHVYVALSLYEMNNGGLPAPVLTLVRQDVEVTDFQSVADPETVEQSAYLRRTMGFPLDPALKNLSIQSPFRISWTYRWHWPNAGNPAAVRLDPRKGVLSSWWQGNIMRINTDGALVEVPRSNSSTLTFADLFGK